MATFISTRADISQADGAPKVDVPLDALRLIASLRGTLDSVTDVLVRGARDMDASWSRIADALGMSKPTAYSRWGASVEESGESLDTLARSISAETATSMGPGAALVPQLRPGRWYLVLREHWTMSAYMADGWYDSAPPRKVLCEMTRTVEGHSLSSSLDDVEPSELELALIELWYPLVTKGDAGPLIAVAIRRLAERICISNGHDWAVQDTEEQAQRIIGYLAAATDFVSNSQRSSELATTNSLVGVFTPRAWPSELHPDAVAL